MAQLSGTTGIVGQYENFLYGPSEKNHYHFVTVAEDESANGGFVWNTLCNEWTLSPIASGKLEFAVGAKCPYFKEGYHRMEFKTDHKGNVIGAFGPGKEYFTKVEQHSLSKYRLKGVQNPQQNENDGGDDEKEGLVTADGDRPMHSLFEWKGGKCVRGQCVGRVSIGENFVVSFGLTVHGKNSEGWESILHVGHQDMERSPGFWLHPKSCKLHVRLSDTVSNNSGYDPSRELEIGREYQVKLQAVDNSVSLFIDGKLQTFKSDVFHVTRFKSTVFVADPWHSAANATVSNLKIYAE